MVRYAALLRAVNVGGRSVSMATLRQVLSTLELHQVATYLQSGNAVFATEFPRRRLPGLIEGALADQLGLDTAVLVRSHRQLSDILAANPYPEVTDPKTLHVTFLEQRPDRHRLGAIDPVFGTDRWAAGKEVLYLHCPQGYGRTKLHNGFWERRLSLVATTRNWRTVGQLAAMTAKT